MTAKQIIAMIVVGVFFWPFMIVYVAALVALAKWLGLQ